MIEVYAVFVTFIALLIFVLVAVFPWSSDNVEEISSPPMPKTEDLPGMLGLPAQIEKDLYTPPEYIAALTGDVVAASNNTLITVIKQMPKRKRKSPKSAKKVVKKGKKPSKPKNIKKK